MKFLLTTFSLIFLFYFSASVASEEKNQDVAKESLKAQKLSENHSPKELRCGEVFSSNNTGGIFYKPFDQIQDNERCVWIVATPGAVGYTVNIQYLGDPTNHRDSGQELILTGARRGDNDDLPVLTSYLPESPGTVNISDANLLIVTFVSRTSIQDNNNGFVLEFHGIFVGNITPSSEYSTHYFIQTPTFEFKYPPQNFGYNNDELAAFVLTPAENTYSGTSAQLWYKQDDLEGGCVDFLTIFKFNSTTNIATERWQADAVICDDLDYYHFFHDDLSLVLFQSSQRNGNMGFWLYFLDCMS